MDQSEDFYKPGGGTPLPNLPDDDSPDPSPATAASSKSFSWQAAEFVEHPHPSSWYAGLFGGSVLLAVLVYLATKDLFATSTILAVGIIVGIYAGRKPGIAQYEISESGLSVNGKNYPYSAFKSFAVLREGPMNSVNLFPLKRFMPPVAAYFDPKDEKKVTDTLGAQLPYEDRKMDPIDRLSRRLRL